LTLERSADLRFLGQAHQLTVALPPGWDAAAMIRAFEEAYARVYGRIPPGVGIQALQWRLTARGPAPSAETPGRGDAETPPRPGATPSPFPSPRGRGDADEAPTLHTVRSLTLPSTFNTTRSAGTRPSTRQAYFDGALRATPVGRRERLAVGEQLDGPLLIEEDASTTVLPPGWRLTVLPTGHLDLRREA